MDPWFRRGSNLIWGKYAIWNPQVWGTKVFCWYSVLFFAALSCHFLPGAFLEQWFRKGSNLIATRFTRWNRGVWGVCRGLVVPEGFQLDLKKAIWNPQVLVVDQWFWRAPTPQSKLEGRLKWLVDGILILVKMAFWFWYWHFDFGIGLGSDDDLYVGQRILMDFHGYYKIMWLKATIERWRFDFATQSQWIVKRFRKCNWNFYIYLQKDFWFSGKSKWNKKNWILHSDWVKYCKQPKVEWKFSELLCRGFRVKRCVKKICGKILLKISGAI